MDGAGELWKGYWHAKTDLKHYSQLPCLLGMFHKTPDKKKTDVVVKHHDVHVLWGYIFYQCGLTFSFVSW